MGAGLDGTTEFSLARSGLWGPPRHLVRRGLLSGAVPCPRSPREKAQRSRQGQSLERRRVCQGPCPLLDNRNQEAWVACCTSRFLPLARCIADDDGLAEDILQESWIRVLKNVCSYRNGPPACA